VLELLIRMGVLELPIETVVCNNH